MGQVHGLAGLRKMNVHLKETPIEEMNGGQSLSFLDVLWLTLASSLNLCIRLHDAASYRGRDHAVGLERAVARTLKLESRYFDSATSCWLLS